MLPIIQSERPILLTHGYMGGTLMPAKPMHHYFAESFGQIAGSLRKLDLHRLTTLYVGHGGPLAASKVQRFLL